MTTKPVALLDLDGVLYPFADEFAEYAAYKGWRVPRSRSERFPNWNFYEAWGMTTPEFLALYRQGYEAERLLHYSEPEYDALDELRQLAQVAAIVWITHRAIPGVETERLEKTTQLWFDRYSVPGDLIVSGHDKGDAVLDLFTLSPEKHVPIIGIVEDKPENLAMMAAVCHAPMFLVDQPWNRPGHADIPVGTIRMLSFWHALRALLQIAVGVY